VLLVLACAVLLAPLWIVSFSEKLTDRTHLLSLLRLFLMTGAFVGALWAIYVKENRLRANSENALVCLIILVSSLISLGFAIACSFIAETYVTALTRGAALISVELYVVALCVLLLNVFVPTYNQLYNLRTNKFYKYFKPFRYLQRWTVPLKEYATTMEKRVLEPNFPDELKGVFASPEDIASLTRGASVLITGAVRQAGLQKIMGWCGQRLATGETLNIVCCDRHPIDLWEQLKPLCQESVHKDIVLIDAYSPTFAFTDDIHHSNDRKLAQQGVQTVRAKTFAGLHSATNTAFSLIQAQENKKKRNVRRPMVMVYLCTSALCEVESVEQFRIFWRHVLPSERNYGMLTIIIEDKEASDEVLSPLRQQVDFVIEFAVDSSGALSFARKK